MTLSDMLAALYSDLGYAAAPESSVTTRLTRYLNDGYLTLLRLPGNSALRQGSVSLASVASQALYGVSPAGVRILSMVDQTNAVTVQEMDLATLRLLDPQDVQSGVPSYRIPMGVRPVLREPATSGVWAASTSNSDTMTVSLYGVTAQGPTMLQTTAVTGTTRVQIANITTYTGIVNWSLSAAGGGAVSLYDAASGGNLLGTIPVGATRVQYQTIRLWPTPDAVYTYAIDVETPVPQLAVAGDSPVLPDDFHPMLVEYGRMREYEYRGDERWPVAKGQFDTNLAALKVRMWNTPDYRPVAGLTPNGPSNLGPWYPAGRW